MSMPVSPVSNHGFSLLGRRSLVLSHIPMFMPPHQAQLFLEVTLSGSTGDDPTQIYLEDQTKSKGTDYVLVSDPLVLPTLAPQAAKRLQSFTGKLYRGWPFNSPNTAPLLVPQLTVQVSQFLYFHSIAHGALLRNLAYLAFATSETAYLVHKLVQPPDLKKAPLPPDFSQILSAKVAGLLAAGKQRVREIHFPEAANLPADKLRAGQSATGEMAGKKVRVQTLKELVYDSSHLT